MKNLIKKIIKWDAIKIPNIFIINSNNDLELQNFAFIGKLSASIIHDILTPLTSIKISTEISNQKDIKSLAPIINNSTEKLEEYLAIMREFLSEDNQNKITNINKEIIKCLKLLRHKAIINNIQIQFLEFDQVYSRINPLHIYQIIVNLVSNAIEASVDSEYKKVIIILKKYKNKFNIECKDFGSGIEEELVRKIFINKFSTKSKSRGLGLYSINYIVNKILNGKLTVESEPNKGSLFSCMLPIIE